MRPRSELGAVSRVQLGWEEKNRAVCVVHDVAAHASDRTQPSEATTAHDDQRRMHEASRLDDSRAREARPDASLRRLTERLLQAGSLPTDPGTARAGLEIPYV